MKKRTLIIGAAPQHLIKEYIAKASFADAEVLLLVPERDRGAYPDQNTSYFKGTFNPFFPPLIKAMLLFKPEEITIVCGATYDHDNIVNSVNFYSNFKDLVIKTSVRNEDFITSPPKPSVLKEIAQFISLGLIALIIKFSSMFKIIRVAEIYSTRIGHLAFDCDIYLSEKSLGKHHAYLDLFYFKDNSVSNETLAELFSQKMHTSKWFEHIHDAIRRFNMTAKHELLLTTRAGSHARDSTGLMHDTKGHIHFTAEQNDKGQKDFEAMNLDKDRPSVCILGRDSMFLQQTIPQFNDADHQEPRNMDINNFKSGVNELLNLNYNVLRMGSIVKDPLKIDHPNFIDYAKSNHRSDFLDIYLASKCKFFVGVQSGLQHVAKVFRVPCLRVNAIRLEKIEYCYPEDLAMFKLTWSKKEKRLLKVHELLESGIGRWPIDKFVNSDIELIDNTEEEILEAMKEMHQKVNGTWTYTEEDLKLKEQYHSLFKPSVFNSRYETPISSYFLRKHAKELF